MNISKGGTRAPNGKVYPNQDQRRLLRKLIADKQEECIKKGIKPIRYKLADFRKWAPELNKLGPPLRSAPKWKNCWFYHKKKRNFFDFFYEKLRQGNQAEKDVCQDKLPKKRNVSGKVQQRKFLELLKQKRQESVAKGERITIITTEDFQNWTKILNKLGHVHPVEKWKMTWKCMKQRKKSSLHFNSDDSKYYKEIGCGSSDEFYLSDDDSTEDIENSLSKESSCSDEEVKLSDRRGRKDESLVTKDDLDRNYLNLCRICLQKKKTMKSFVEGSYKNISYLDIYHECIGEAFKLYNFCSMEICDLCEKNLLNAYQFRMTCLQTDTQLLFIENYKEKLKNSSESTSDEDKESLSISSKVESDESRISDMDALEEKSIPDDVFLNIENPLQEHIEEFNDTEPLDQRISSRSDDNSESSFETNNSDFSHKSDKDPLARPKRVQRKSRRINQKDLSAATSNRKKIRAEKERPNREQIVLLRKLVAEKQANCVRFGVQDNRPVKSDFKRWTPQLNALGPPVRPLNKWKDCWFIHKKKKNGFYEFINRSRRRRDNAVSKLNNNPNARGKMNRKQLEILEKFIQERRAKSAENRVQIYTQDFIDLRCMLNKSGPPFRSVNEWKFTWRHTKKNAKKNPRKKFAIDVHELGCESSDAYYFTNESSAYSSDSELPSTSAVRDRRVNFAKEEGSLKSS